MNVLGHRFHPSTQPAIDLSISLVYAIAALVFADESDQVELHLGKGDHGLSLVKAAI